MYSMGWLLNFHLEKKKKVRKLGVHQYLVLYLFASFNLQHVFSHQALAHQNGHTVVHLTILTALLLEAHLQNWTERPMNWKHELKDPYSSIYLFSPNK